MEAQYQAYLQNICAILGVLYSMTLEMAFRKLNFTLGSALIFTVCLWDKKGSEA
jgi:hypothetical protein